MIETTIQMRFADVDMLGHVNNVSQQHYFDVGKTAFLGELLGTLEWQEEGLITVGITSNYLKQIRMNEPIAARTQIAKIGTKSFTLSQQIVNTQTGEVKSEGSSVLVAFDFVAQTSIPLPERWRERFEAYRAKYEEYLENRQ